MEAPILNMCPKSYNPSTLNPKPLNPKPVLKPVKADLRDALRVPFRDLKVPLKPTVNPRKLEHRFRMIHAGIPYTLL